MFINLIVDKLSMSDLNLSMSITIEYLIPIPPWINLSVTELFLKVSNTVMYRFIKATSWKYLRHQDWVAQTSIKFKSQFSFNWHLNFIEVCATQSRLFFFYFFCKSSRNQLLNHSHNQLTFNFFFTTHCWSIPLVISKLDFFSLILQSNIVNINELTPDTVNKVIVMSDTPWHCLL